MKINWETNIYGLIGNPIEGSYSPLIHNYIYGVENINNIYTCFNIEDNFLGDAISGFKAINIRGFNVTIPYKEKIIPYLDEVSEEARNIGAINTVKYEGGKLKGTNTDGLGFIKIFKDEEIILDDKNILMIGAGGAAKGIGFSLVSENIKSLMVLNRTKKRADNLKLSLDKLNKKVEIKSCSNVDLLDKKNIDILINATSIGMAPDYNSCPIDLDGFKDDLIVLDVIYKPLKTQLLQEADKRGYKNFNGIGMLVNQAILSQEFWLDRNLSRGIRDGLVNYLNEYLGG